MSNDRACLEVSALGVRRIKNLIWLYFWLLIFEGALRKWVIPELSAPLLIIRDPVALAAYYLGARYGLFYRNKPLLWICSVCFVFLGASFAQYVLWGETNPIVSVYGLRTNFLHLPLVVLTALVFTRDDVERMGRWLLVTAVPMAILMVLQFRATPDDILNRTASGEGSQISSAMGKIRPPGTFSFITGVVQYFTLVSAFVFFFATQKNAKSKILVALCGCSIMSALAVSGSRLAIISVAIVVAGFGASCVADARLMKRAVVIIVAAMVLGAGVAMTDFFDEGMQVMATRVENATETEESSGGVSGRVLDNLAEPFRLLDDTPFLGHGLGVGTNVGAMLIAGRVEFLLSEGEWSRIVQESGPLLGLLYLFMRLGLAFWIGGQAWKSARQGNALPLLLFTACAPNFINGSFGQPTTLGFAALGAGLCLAACRVTAPGQSASA